MKRNGVPLPLLATLVVTAFTVLAYRAGLHGGFLFDDFANLPALGSTGPITHWDTFWRYVTSGTADPTGRPVALLSFLLDARDWPASAYPFKRTNLVLHLVNGLLLFALLRRLGRHLTPSGSDRKRADWAATLGASLWMAHPLFVSTTLYIVQREAMLPTTFTLLGLLAWLKGRTKLLGGDTRQGVGWLFAGLGVCTLLAFLSKANGILLPSLALVLEYALLRPAEKQPRMAYPATYKAILGVFAVVPTSIIVLFLVHAGWHGLTAGLSDARPWTMSQRLLTEPRMLATYLHMLWLPTPFTAGLFNDQIAASTSLFQPWSTLPSIALVIGLIAMAWTGRHRWPVLSSALLFYFAGQSIESSSVPLELFFEHRNYLPALLMFWPLAWWICAPAPRAVGDTSRSTNHGQPTSLWRHLRIGLAVVAVATCLTMTHVRADLWGNSHDQAILWARLNPASPRAQAFAAQAEMAAGRPGQAIGRLETALGKYPSEVQLALNLVAARCVAGNLDDATLESATRALATTRDTGSLLTSWFGRAINQVAGGSCPKLDFREIEQLLLAAQHNPRLSNIHGRQQDVYYLRGVIAIKQGKPDDALALFNEGLAQEPRETLALSQAAALGAAGFPAQGLAHLAYFRSTVHPPGPPHWNMATIHAWVLQRQGYWPKEFNRLRDTLHDDLEAEEKPHP